MPGHVVHVVVGGNVVRGAATQVWDVRGVALHLGNHSGMDSKQPSHYGQPLQRPSRFLVVKAIVVGCGSGGH